MVLGRWVGEEGGEGVWYCGEGYGMGGEGSPIFEVFESFGKFGVVFEGGGETCRPPGSGVVRGGLKWG